MFWLRSGNVTLYGLNRVFPGKMRVRIQALVKQQIHYIKGKKVYKPIDPPLYLRYEGP